jgi:protein tyrosine/serine phosphatase
VLRDPEAYPRPVLVHCFAGIHRTGAYCAVYRMEVDRWPPYKALQEMECCGYTNMEGDVRGFLLNYQPSWKQPPEGMPNDP